MAMVENLGNEDANVKQDPKKYWKVSVQSTHITYAIPDTSESSRTARLMCCL